MVKVKKGTSVFIVGLGGLGCPALRYLASAGVARIGAADFDRVAETNLPRQLFYRAEDIGRAKVEVCRERIGRLPGAASLAIEFYEAIVRGDEEYLGQYDVVIDAADHADVKFALHDHVVSRGELLIHAAATGWRGQMMTISGPGCLRCLFGPGDAGAVPDCRSAGIVGPVVGMMGLFAAAEAVRILSGETPHRLRRFFSVDFRAGRSRTVEVAPDPLCEICGG